MHQALLKLLLAPVVALRHSFVVGWIAISLFLPNDLALARALVDSGIQGPPYAAIEQELRSLLAVGIDINSTIKPRLRTVLIHYGNSVEGRRLLALRVSRPFVGKKRPAVIMSGAIHGNEYLNVEDRLPRWFVEQHATSPGLRAFLDAGGVIYAIPIANPDGYERRLRNNANQIDLNRDFDLLPENERFFTQPESRHLASWLDADLKALKAELKLSVDYHCCADALLFPWSYTEDALPEPILFAHEMIARAMQELIDPTYTFGSTGQVLGYTPRGTAKDYYFARYNALAFTFEGQYANEHKKFVQHTRWWDSILKDLAQR